MAESPKTQEIADTLFVEPSHPLGTEDLRMGIFIDRAEGRCAAMILNTSNNKYAFLTVGEHVIKDSNDYDSVMRAVNAACEDIVRWNGASDEEVQGDL